MSGTAQNADQIVLGPAAIYYGTAGEEATLPFGYTDEDGVVFTPTAGVLEAKTGQRLGVVKRLRNDATCSLSGNFLQLSLANLAQVIPGAELASNVLSMDPTTTTLQEMSLKVVGLDPDGNVRTIRIPYANPSGEPAITMNASNWQVLPFEFQGISRGTTMWSITDGSGDEAVTLATGAFARTVGQTYYKMSGEGAAADALTDITGTSLTNNELLILQIASAAQPITITHAAGVIELDGEVNFVMGDLGDTLWLRYNTSGSKWVEVGRYVARSDV